MNFSMKVIEHPVMDASYECALSKQIICVLSSGPKRFPVLLEGLLGAFPADVLQVLGKLRDAGEVRSVDAQHWELTDTPPLIFPDSFQVVHPEGNLGDFPEPHPLDYDWRFTARSVEHLCERISARAPRGKVALLGTPTLLGPLKELRVDAYLFDKNAALVHQLRQNGFETAVHADVFQHVVTSRDFDVVMADPPWYLEYYRGFIESARYMLRDRGTLFLSVPGALTRPSAERDRETIVEFADSRGFTRISEELGLLRYATPPFEHEALRDLGLELPAWRKGDLFEFSFSFLTIDQLELPLLDTEQWCTFSIGPTVVKVKPGTEVSEDAFTVRAVGSGGYRLHTVSRRSPVRRLINLWTSRNIALQVSRPDILIAALQKLQQGTNSQAAAAEMAAPFCLEPHERAELAALLELLLQDATIS